MIASARGAIRGASMTMKAWIREHSPGAYARALSVRDALRTIRFSTGKTPRTCNLCGYSGMFLGFGVPLRFDALCRGCGSAERHRLLVRYLSDHEEMIRGKEILHFAPETSLKKYLTKFAHAYTGADLYPSGDSIKLNIEQLEMPDCCFDVVFCCHVLEHVDDRKALSELFRVLRPKGVAFLMVPIIEGWRRTYENRNVISGRDREVHFGQSDHVRFYGRDFRERITSVGFDLSEYSAEEPYVLQFGLTRGERVFIAQKL